MIKRDILEILKMVLFLLGTYTLPSTVVPCTEVLYRYHTTVTVLRIRIWEDPKLMAWSGSEINISDLDSDPDLNPDPKPDPKQICKKELYIQAKIR